MERINEDGRTQWVRMHNLRMHLKMTMKMIKKTTVTTTITMMAALRNREIIAEEAFVRRKPFYLEPIPSFHEQDVHRVRTLHVDSIVQMSVIENSQKMVAQAMNDYNQALRRSSDLQTQKIKLENEQKEASGNGLPSET